MAGPAAVDAVARTILALRRDRPVRALIDGRSAAGKTTFSAALGERIARSGRQVLTIHFDDFHPNGYRPQGSGPYTPARYLEEGYDFEAFERLVLAPTGREGDRRIAVALPAATDAAPQGSVRLAEDGVLLVEGAFLLKPALRRWWDYAIWLDISYETMVERAAARDIAWAGDDAKVRARYEGFWTQTHGLYETCGARDAAHALINNEDIAKPCLVRAARPAF